ncbi:hypothetical protein EAN95_23690 [Klebsiella quasipneumoniae]|nr:hypothetical protein EAN95_23690 [Klebsiella quasipneumoniae]
MINGETFSQFITDKAQPSLMLGKVAQFIYTHHSSSCMRVGFGFPRSPQSLTYVSSWGFAASPPSCNSHYFGYRLPQITIKPAADRTAGFRYRCRHEPKSPAHPRWPDHRWW